LQCDLSRSKFLQNFKPLYLSRTYELEAFVYGSKSRGLVLQIYVNTLVMVSIFNFNFILQYKAPTATPIVVKLVRAIVLDPNQILSNLNDLGESIWSIRCPNRPIGTLFEPRNRAGSCASFAKSYRRFRVQMNKSTPKQ
jgi:hypothetical protein